MPQYNFKIVNLDCPACIKLSTSALKSLSGVQDVKIDLKTGDTQVVSENELNWEDIKSSLAQVDKIAEK